MPWECLRGLARAVWAGIALADWATRAGIANAQLAPLPSVPWQPGPERYSVAVPGSSRPTLSLYPPGGAVAAATGGSLRSALHGSGEGGRAWHFLELYDHMCPHCWYAVPVVTDVARAFSGSPMLRIASLNCHMRDNAEACFFLEIISGAMDYPTFLLCPPQGSKPIVDEETIRSLPQRAQSLLQHLVGSQRTAFMELLRCRIRYIEKQARAGGEDPFLSARAVAEWVTDKTGLEAQHLERLTQGADFTSRAVPDPRAAPGRPGWLRDDKDGSPGVPAWVPGQRWFDALRGLVALLHQGYRESRHQAAVDSAWFLAHTFPVKGRELGDLAQKLRKRGPIAEPMEFRKFLASWARKSGIPDPLEGLADVTQEAGEEERYTTCDGSSCVMWSLLHVALTAVAARGVSGRSLLGDESLAADGEAGRPVRVHEAVQFVRTFVEAFLSCRQCKVNFLRDFDSCEYGRCTIADFRALPLWLWRAHNAVSLRVALRHNAQVDRRWPMYEDCPTCWRQELVMGGRQYTRRLQGSALSVEELDAPFHVDRVFWHMVRTYVGVQRVAFELSDLSRDEQEEVQAVLERERAIAAGEPPPPPGSLPPVAAERGPGWVWPLRKLAISVAALAWGIVGLLCYHQCDISRVAQMFATPERTTRAPMIRSPQDASAVRRDEEDDDLVEDAGRPQGGGLERDDGPAAE